MTDRPNIIVMLTDDHGQWALGCCGNSEVRSPNMDRLASTGVVMENAYTPLPVCSPGRASFFTGRFPSQHGIHDYLSKAADELPWLNDEVLLSELLRDAGYTTGFSGKWHCGGGRNQPQPGFDFWKNKGGRGLTKPEISQVIMDQSLEFLQTRDRSKPFFLFMSDIATHSAWKGHTEEIVESYRNCSFCDVPQAEEYPFGNLSGSWTAESAANREETLAQYYAAVTEIDDQIGRLLEELENQDLLENTLVVYTSDHGICCSHHGIWGKGNGTRPLNMMEESIRIPMILSQPGTVVPGKRRTEFADHCDLFQTLLDHAGVELPDAMREERNYPGRSFREMLLGDDIADWKCEQFGEYGYLRMVRTPTHKLVRRALGRPSELFDLVADPRETTNCIDDPTCADVLADLQGRINDFFTKYEDPEKSGLRVLELPEHNGKEAWRGEQP